MMNVLTVHTMDTVQSLLDNLSMVVHIQSMVVHMNSLDVNSNCFQHSKNDGSRLELCYFETNRNQHY